MATHTFYVRNADHDGYTLWDGTNYMLVQAMYVRYGKDPKGPSRFRGFASFQVDTMPPYQSISSATLWIYLSAVGGGSLMDMGLYGNNVAYDPVTDSDEVRYARSNTNTYINDWPSSLGWRSFALSVADLINCLNGGYDWSLGFREEGDDSTFSNIDDYEIGPVHWPYIVVEYTPPPIVLGGSALPQVQMAKAILEVCRNPHIKGKVLKPWVFLPLHGLRKR